MINLLLEEGEGRGAGEEAWVSEKLFFENSWAAQIPHYVFKSLLTVHF